jgi:CheY-like chemotaxis protein
MGFRLVLDAEDDIEVVGEAADGAVAVSMCSALRPDVVLMDVRMPGHDGIEATRDIVAAGLPCKVLILTTFDLDDYVYAGLRAGASGFLLKDTQPYRRRRRCRPGADRHHPPGPRVRRQPTARSTQRAPRRPASADAHRPRAGRLLPHRGGHVQQRDRGQPVPVRGDSEDSRRPHPGQARPARPRPSRRARLRIQADNPRNTPARGQPSRGFIAGRALRRCAGPGGRPPPRPGPRATRSRPGPSSAARTSWSLPQRSAPGR